MPLFSSGFWAGKYNSFQTGSGSKTLIGYITVTVGGTQYVTGLYAYYDYLKYYQYDQNLNQTVSQVGYFMKYWNEHGVTSNWVDSVTGTGIYTGIDTTNMPVVVKKASKTLPNDYTYLMPITEYQSRTATVTKETQLVSTNYTNGAVEWNFPADTYMMKGYYLKVMAPSLTNETANIKLIYEN